MKHYKQILKFIKYISFDGLTSYLNNLSSLELWTLKKHTDTRKSKISKFSAEYCDILTLDIVLNSVI